MAKKERQKRAARKARQKERAEREERAVEAAPAGSDKDARKVQASASKEVKKADKKDKPKKQGRIRTYFRDVRTEMHRVVWPSRSELKNYSVAVIVMLIVFGIAVWLVDTGVLAVLAGYTGLRG